MPRRACCMSATTSSPTSSRPPTTTSAISTSSALLPCSSSTASVLPASGRSATISCSARSRTGCSTPPISIRPIPPWCCGSRNRREPCCSGPLVFAFVAWLARHPAVPHLRRLFFVSREGWFLRRLYDAVREETGRMDLPPSSYLHCSRRAALAAAQGRGLDPDAVLRGAGFNGSLAAFLAGPARLRAGSGTRPSAPPGQLPARRRAGALRRRVDGRGDRGPRRRRVAGFHRLCRAGRADRAGDRSASSTWATAAPCRPRSRPRSTGP